MLKGISPLLNADVLYALRAMGHGDDLIIADTNFPSNSVARQTALGKLLQDRQCDGGRSRPRRCCRSTRSTPSSTTRRRAWRSSASPRRSRRCRPRCREVDRAEGKLLADDAGRALSPSTSAPSRPIASSRPASAASMAASPSARASCRPRPDERDGSRPRPIVILGVFVADTAYRAARQPRHRRDHPRQQLQARAGRQGLEPGGGRRPARRRCHLPDAPRPRSLRRHGAGRPGRRRASVPSSSRRRKATPGPPTSSSRRSAAKTPSSSRPALPR